MNSIKKIFATFLICFFSHAVVSSQLDNLLSSGVQLSASSAFSSYVENFGDKLNVIIKSEPDYYIYKDKIKVFYNDNKQDIKIKQESSLIKDEFFGDSEVYNYGVSFNIDSKFKKDTKVVIEFQGCSKKFNICYPPISDTYEIKGSDAYKKTKESNKMSDILTTNSSSEITSTISQYKNSPYLYIIFVVVGIMTVFTPCFYPLLPVVIASTRKAKNPEIAVLSYILGIVFLYFLIGIAVGLLNFNIQILSQTSTSIIITSSVLLFSALYMSGLINITIFSSLNGKISTLINGISSKNYFGNFIIGFLSSLMLSPCSVAPLLGVLVFINEMGEPLLGAALLSLMAVGIGIPLFLISSFFLDFIPKSGNWLNIVKSLFSFIFAALAITTISSLIEPLYVSVMYLILCTFYGFSLIDMPIKKIIGFFIIIMSIALFCIKITHSITQRQNKAGGELIVKLNYDTANTNLELNNLISSSSKPIFIDYYADWCSTCVRFEKSVINNEFVINYLNKNYNMIKIDLTELTKEKKSMMKVNNILAIPYYIVVNKDKKQIKYSGQINLQEFKTILKNSYVQ